jgi:hypothetical protein
MMQKKGNFMKDLGIDWVNLIAFSASSLAIFSTVMRVFYIYFHKDIEIMKEEQKSFKEELKIIHQRIDKANEKSDKLTERTDKIIMEQNARMDGIYNLLLKKFGD